MTRKEFLKGYWGVEIQRIREKTFREEQSEFGAQVGVTQSQISRYETGDTEPPEDVILEIIRISKDVSLYSKYMGDQDIDKDKGRVAMYGEEYAGNAQVA